MSDPAPFSPTASSLSSSDLDTESTGSFFHDRSTSLGTLMGVTFQAITTFRASSQHRHPVSTTTTTTNNCRRKNKRRWWMLCREEERRASLGDYLEVERRFGGEIEEVVRELPRNGRVLFEDGRVLPPVEIVGESSSSGICRFSAVVYFTGICNCRRALF